MKIKKKCRVGFTTFHLQCEFILKSILSTLNTLNLKTSKNAATLMDAMPMLNAQMPTVHTLVNVMMATLVMASIVQVCILS